MESAGRVHRVALVPGDGIGPEVTAAVRRVFEAAAAPVAWEEHPAGLAALRAGRELLSEETIDAIRRAKVALKGPRPRRAARHRGLCRRGDRAARMIALWSVDSQVAGAMLTLA
jgi:isocitrate/isopropylmalate dehydrogenase